MNPSFYAVNIAYMILESPPNKMVPLMEDHGGGGARGPLLAHGLIYSTDHETPLWPLMARRRLGSGPSVAIMMFRVSRIYAGPAC